jgi:hypothetical protein
MPPSPGKRERDVGLPSAHLFRDETSAMLAERALCTRDDASLVVSEPHVAEHSVRQRVEANGCDRGARRA